MKNILIVDHTDYKNELYEQLKNHYKVFLTDSAFDAIAKLNTFDIDLVVSQVELPGDNAFDLYNYLQKNFTYIPTIMITEKNIDVFFDKIFREGIGNVLQIPVNKDEFLNLSEKLITKKNIFGIENYLQGLLEKKHIRISSSNQIQPAVNKILEMIESWNFSIKNKLAINLILNELIINAVYHSHGYTEQKLKRMPIKLKDDEYVDIHFGLNGKSYCISVTDYRGKLNKFKILESIYKAIEQEQLIIKAAETGEDISNKISESGRGIDLVRKLASEFYFVLHYNRQTEIILIFNIKDKNKLTENLPSSLKIVEAI